MNPKPTGNRPQGSLARVVRSAAPGSGTPASIVVSTLQGMRVVPSSEPDLQPGDLVFVGPRGAVLVSENVSERPPDQQDWWRIHRIAPFLRERAKIQRLIRRWFEDQGFLEVSTPILARCPGLEVHLHPIRATVGSAERHLITSPEYHMKRLLAGGFEKLVYFGPAFRDDERGPHHLPEFTMLEWYRAGADPPEIMADVERVVALAMGRSEPWTTLTVKDALRKFADLDLDADDKKRRTKKATEERIDAIHLALVERVEPALAALGNVHLIEWPAELASLAQLKEDDPTVSERFEAYVGGIELSNGFGELTDPAEQRARFEADLAERRRLKLPVFPIDENFLDALATGIPRCSGVALGFDRLVMKAVGARTLDDVVPFPPELA